MKAAVFHGADEGVRVEEIPVPQVGPDQVLVKVAACGACHTDLHYIEHGVPTFKAPPIVLGHEASGIVEEVGVDVDHLSVGQRVLIPAVLTCGKCKFCRMGKENICADMKMLGNHFDGAYAEYVCVPAKDVLDLPESIPLLEASIIADALSTPYHAVKNRAQVRPGDTVAVFGCGGVGINAVQLAAAAGAYVIAVDINPKRLEMADSVGADELLDGADPHLIKKIFGETSLGGVDVVLEMSGSSHAVVNGLRCLKKGGSLISFGIPGKPVELDLANDVILPGRKIIGVVGRLMFETWEEMQRLMDSGKLDPAPIVTHKYSLADWEPAFDTLKSGEAGKVVLFP